MREFRSHTCVSDELIVDESAKERGTRKTELCGRDISDTEEGARGGTQFIAGSTEKEFWSVPNFDQRNRQSSHTVTTGFALSSFYIVSWSKRRVLPTQVQYLLGPTTEMAIKIIVDNYMPTN